MKSKISQYLSKIGKRGGESTSPAKIAAVRVNGAKGGRPKKSEKKSESGLTTKPA